MRDEGDDAYPTDEFVGGALQRLARSLRLTAADLERAGSDIATGNTNLAALEETVERVSDLRGQRDGIESGLMHILTVLRNRRRTP